MADVLLVEDEPDLRTLLRRLLADAGHRVTAKADGRSALRSAQAEPPDLVILDLMLPDITGEEVLHALLAERPRTRILVLSAVTEVDRRIGVLDSGAADFVAKPFINSEFLARVRARLRGEEEAPPGAVARFMSGAGFHLDLQRRELVVNGRRILLSQRELLLLAHLMHRRGDICSRQEILSSVWGIEFDPGTNVVDVYIQRLRSKLPPDNIQTVRNAGYRFTAQ